MRRVIEGLKEQRVKAEKAFIMSCLIKRTSPINLPVPDTESYLDEIRELNEAIGVLENDTMQKPCNAKSN
tara:strand:- start:235 stop:444 length:210 start_codon:yes stop_codon:yes gene_type:complete